MIIIIEGPDGSGKTTLANQLVNQTGYKLIHMSYPKTEEEKLNMHLEYKKLIANSTNIIIDRAWYSEMVYGPIMREGSMITYPDMYELERLVARNGGMVIYCTDAPSILWRRCTKRGEDYIVCRDDFNNICSGFDILMTKCPHLIPVVTYKIPV